MCPSAAGEVAAAAAPCQCSVPAEHLWAPRRVLWGHKTPSCPHQSSLVCELGNAFGPTSQQMLLASLAKLICVEGTQTKTQSKCLAPFCYPPMYMFTRCLRLVFHHFPPTPSPGTGKATQIFPTAETCGDVHRVALAGGQDTPWCRNGRKLGT